MSDLDLGVVGNCSFAALIDRDARVVWCCTPRFDAPTGPHDWLTRTVIVGTGQRFLNPDYTLFRYFAVEM